ncbi:uncharacterized protein LOC128238522 isoform X2 [Mya arenaria]|nr:uncharacterized protein LOC128238522 isoform X2 [Mya arenaria]XP_052810478.1 uncharacterized protein LOC128238522 isoform X2 [Mya arenaria]XP_052810479.1 uncharacterized protein LOC128238522 isoform X2 [Mya arenaria]XP_052810480.1 uncharacterized protein LOC128238522 isoform X2 [Mya arenaria]XP_052810481.1 uncharacterized protein LOC128238522 isoform X2 [Mya arenaria]XP_052810482.1 uncharacterized protein LOC128238522 isoform X2 [Mya arenaria]
MDEGGTGGLTINDRLRQAAGKGLGEEVAQCLQAGATFDADQDGRTALHYAALNGYPDVARFLVEKGCDIDIQDDSGYTALHRAASQGHLEVITTLLEAGCDPNTQDEHGNAAIHEAAWNGYSKTLELLVKFDANVSIVNKAGFTALHLSAQNGHNESSRVLLYAGCNSDLKNNYGDTTIHTGARYGHAGVTRILISARAKLNEQNKNGDTALHIAAALKRRKIAKLLVDSGVDVFMKNKQNETAIDVARRKDHVEIISIIQAYSRPVKPIPKEVNFKLDHHEPEGPIVVPDNRNIPEKQEKGKSRFLFFKKKKSKDKDKTPQGRSVSPQGRVPVGGDLRAAGQTPVQGFFSKYVPREGVQYYRDLAGNVKQGPVGYSPTCNCHPAINQLQKEIHDTQDHVYGRIHNNNRVLNDRIDQVDHRSSMRVQALEKYTHDQFHEEKNRCRQRIDHRLDEYGDAGQDHMKSQIQNWLEQKLEGYGHCLHHHHDDSALPNDNIFTEVHETANGRLFKSRSDETLSQSDNHSGKFRKRNFYESRQQAMQQIRAWQVPSYSKDKYRVKISAKQTANATGKRSQSQHNVNNTDIEPARQYPIEPKVEVRTYASKNLPNTIGRNMARTEDHGDYMAMTGSPQPVQRAPSRPQPQVYQSTRQQGTSSRGPVTHSTPKSRESSPYTTHTNIVRSHTDGYLAQGSPRQLTFQDISHSTQESTLHSSSGGQGVMTYTKAESFGDVKSARSDLQLSKASSASPTKSTTSATLFSSGYRNSTSSDKLMPENPKPTFTTFGYDETMRSSAQPNNQEDQIDMSGQGVSVGTPRSASSHSSRAEEQMNKTQISGNSMYSRQISQSSHGFSPSHHDDMYVEMKNFTPAKLHQRARSSDGLLETDVDHVHSSQNMAQSFNTHDATQLSVTARSSSETRNILRAMSPTPAPQQPSRNITQSPANTCNKTISHPKLSSTPTAIPNSFTRPAERSVERPIPPPKPSVHTVPNKLFGANTADRHYAGNINFKSTLPRPENPYTTVKQAQFQRDLNQNYAVMPEVHPVPTNYYSQGLTNGTNGVPAQNQLEPRSKFAIQTYLTETPPFDSQIQRENSPNICNNSKEDSSSNPDSGYSSKIYGNRASSVQPPSCGSTPSSSFSTDRGLTSNTNSPQSQYSSTDYEYLPKRQYDNEVHTPMNNWYHRQIQETTQKVYDSWRNDRSPRIPPQQQQQQRLPASYYGNGDYVSANQIQASRANQSGYTLSGQQNHLVSTYVMHGSDV